MSEKFFQFLDGRTYVRDGISGVIHYTPRNHYQHGVPRQWTLEWWPDEQGRQTKEYRKICDHLGGDWITDMLSGDLGEDDPLVRAVTELGLLAEWDAMANDA